MNDRFEATTIDEVDEVRKYFNRFRDEINLFHDDYVAGIEIKFENYRSLNDDGRYYIGSADTTIILTVDTYPYGKEHNQFVKVEFKDVKSFEILSSSEADPTWAISHTLISDSDDGSGIEWEFGFLWGGAKYLVICSKLVFCKQIRDVAVRPKVEGKTSSETAGGCCGTSKSDALQSVENLQRVQPSGTPETDKTSPKTPQSDDADTGGCGCGS